MAGLGTRLFKVDVDGVERSAEVSNVRLVTGDADSDFVTFAQAAAGGSRQYTLAFTAVQDLVADTLWDLVWTTPGAEVNGTYMPYGNAIASPTQPHFDFTAVIKEPDGDFLGGDADVSTTARMTFEAEWELTAKPTKVVA